MIVSIHQPDHLPWLGFFHKAIQADLFVILDHAQFRKNNYQNRSMIRTDQGWTWITLPVLKPLVAPINEIRANLDSPLRKRYTDMLQSHYQHAPFFEEYFLKVSDVILSNHDKIVETNLELIRLGLDAFDISTPVVTSSTLDLPPAKGPTDVNLAVCKHVGAKTYLSGISGKDYLDCQRFADNGIEVEFQEFHHPIYRQMHEPFIGGLSAVDLLFNHGPASKDVIEGIGVETMETLFV